MLEATLSELRQQMVAIQLRNRGLTDERVLARMASVPRHCFVPHELMAEAYADHPLPIGEGQTISQPYMVAYMTALLELRESDHVLEVGTGSGYHTAVLSGLCRTVISVERKATLRERAQATLGQLHIDNVSVHGGDGSLGFPAGAPFDAIVVAAASPSIPVALCGQLKDGGCLVCPAGGREHQTLFRILKQGNEFVTTAHTACCFVPLIGEAGWPEAEDVTNPPPGTI